MVAAITSNKTEDDSSYSIDLLGTASDADNSDSLSVSNQSASAVDGNGSTISIPSGALSLSGQNLTVDPNEFNYLAVGESVVITYSYDVADGTTTTANTATITITGANDAPVVSAITSNKTEDESSYSIDLLGTASDADNSDSLSVSNQSASAVDGNGSTISIPSGALSLSGQNLTVDPNEFNYLAVGESVVITYSYDVADGTTTTANTATITITGANDAPVVAAITSNKTEDDSSYSIDLLGTASDADNSDSLSVSNQSASAVDGNGSTISIPSGALSLSGQNLTVDPNEFNYLAVGESVVITYSYDVADGTTTTANTATITITGANDAPVVAAITSNKTEDDSSYADNSIDLLGTASTPITPIHSPFPTSPPPLLMATVPPSPFLRVLSLSGQNLTVDPNEFNYLAVGESVVITYSYDVADGTTTTANTATITITGANDAPVVAAITSNKTEDDSSYSIDLLGTASDADNSDQLSESVVITLRFHHRRQQSASAVDRHRLGRFHHLHSSSAVDALSLSGQNLTVDPNEFNYLAVGESVVITYSYDVADGTTTTANTATITITGANDAPVVAAITSNKTEDDSSYSIDLLGTASDADNSDSLSVSNQSASAVDGNGSTISIPSGALSLSQART